MPTGQYDRHPGLNDGLPYELRRCSKCLEVKPRSDYSPDKRLRPDGIQATCKVCRKKREAEWRAANPEELKRRARAFYLKHRPRKDAYAREWYKRNPTKKRDYALKARHGLAPEQYEAMLAQQGHACAICRKPFNPSRPKAAHTDHDHATGRVRGILCGGCNIALGHMDKPGFIDAALAYLARHSGLQIGRSA